ncbi:MAG: TonB C-terminal domain-containing protein [Muribaculaceae bacterium]|nr:TonB C-terminal domain-containing protein [Muribaculaceae bacterium]
MRKFIGIFVLLFLLAFASCNSRPKDRLSMMRTIHGYTYDRISGESLNGAVILNSTDDHAFITDTLGKFSLTAHLGDSLNIKFVGMKDSVIVVSKNTPSYLEIGLDTVTTTLIDPDLIFLKHISETDFKPFQIDNGDDYVKCGTYRIVDDKGRIGFANADGYIVLEPKFVFAFPYEKGIAKVTEKGILKEVEGSNGEYHYWESDEWYYINMSGDRLSTAMNPSDGIQKADSIEFIYFNNEWILGAGISMACPESITKIEIKNDEYGNRCAYISMDSNAIESLKQKVEQSNEGIWVDYFNICEFPGGNSKMKNWIEENIRIPDGFKGKERVMVNFLVMPDGRVSGGKIFRGSENEELNAEALRLIENLPKFNVEYYCPQKKPFKFLWPITFVEKKTVTPE